MESITSFSCWNRQMNNQGNSQQAICKHNKNMCWCYCNLQNFWKMKYQVPTYLTWEMNKSLETMCTNSTKQGEEFKTMFRIVFKVFGDHLIWKRNISCYQSELSFISKWNMLVLTIYLKSTLEDSLKDVRYFLEHLTFVPT